MNDITVFKFEQSEVEIFVDENGNPWFCAKQVCDVLGYKNQRDAIARHTTSRGVVNYDSVKTLSNGRKQAFKIPFINESNLYRLVMHSKLKGAERFQDWVCEEVLPSIRKTGRYIQQSITLPDFTDPAAAARAWANEYEQRKHLEAEKEAARPMLEFAQDIRESEDDIRIGEAAKLLDMPVRKFFDLLRELDWIFQKTSEPKAMARNKGWMKVKYRPFTDNNGREHQTPTGYITGKGLEKLHQILKTRGFIPPTHQLNFNLIMQ